MSWVTPNFPWISLQENRARLALSGTVHWTFDRGLISIADNHELLFAKGKIPEPVMGLLNPDRRLLAPSRPEQAPHPIFLRWRRENVFKG
ncbi:MAG TPA: HNH endonuclease [Roseiarcus sp.]|nr:HNH endonuclease [Roseiarcus sp.]